MTRRHERIIYLMQYLQLCKQTCHFNFKNDNFQVNKLILFYCIIYLQYIITFLTTRIIVKYISIVRYLKNILDKIYIRYTSNIISNIHQKISFQKTFQTRNF